ncbi:MAG: hypothetical protein M3Q30_20925 [Actinomycetota bacterium]|nr:hypothetical protein [Actinomycetota bacterium]
MSRRRTRVWWHNSVLQRAFERQARVVHPDLVSTFDSTRYRLCLAVPVPGYEARAVEIMFSGNSKAPRVYADGPTASPHRYADEALCMWHPRDPIEQRWVRKDGLRALIALIVEHLFREAWWRDTGGRDGGEWLGPEAPHAPTSPEGIASCSS